MAMYFKYSLFCLLFILAISTQAQNIKLAGKVYRTSSCASGGYDYYFFPNGKMVITYAIGGEIYKANAIMASWQQQGDKVIITKHYAKLTKPAPDAQVVSVAADTQYDKYVGYSIDSFTGKEAIEILDLTGYEDGGDCSALEENFEKEASSFFQDCLRNRYAMREYTFVSERLLTENELKKYTKEQLAIMRNEVFASYGYNFSSEKWRKYFSEKGIMGMMTDVDAFITDIELKNIALIKKFENQ